MFQYDFLTLVNRPSAFGIETFKITNLLKNKKIAKALTNAGLGDFLTIPKTKAETRGIPVTEADPFFASSKTCRSCGH